MDINVPPRVYILYLYSPTGHESTSCLIVGGLYWQLLHGALCLSFSWLECHLLRPQLSRSTKITPHTMISHLCKSVSHIWIESFLVNNSRRYSIINGVFITRGVPVEKYVNVYKILLMVQKSCTSCRLRLVVYPMIFRVLYIPDGCFGISGPSIGMFDTLVVAGTPKRTPLWPGHDSGSGRA